jgi:nucleoside phosphorylase
MTGRHDLPISCVIACALPPEAIAVRAGLRGGRGNGVRVALTGMGPKFARRAVGRLASSLPDGVPVVILGVGGGLVSGFSPGDLVVADSLGLAETDDTGGLEVSEPPRPVSPSSSVLSQTLFDALSAAWPSTSLAPMLSATGTAKGAERTALAECGAVICDTESWWLSRVSSRRPFAVVRAIVDTPERELVSLQTVAGGVTGLLRLSQVADDIARVASRAAR